MSYPESKFITPIASAYSGITPGTVIASKAVITDANNKVNTLDITAPKIGGVAITPTAAKINLLVQGVASGYKMAYGTAVVGAASADIVTGLTTVIGAVVSLVGDPSATHAMSTCTVGNQTGAPVAGSIRIKSWKFTAAGDTALIAADSVFANVAWVAFGT